MAYALRNGMGFGEGISRSTEEQQLVGEEVTSDADFLGVRSDCARLREGSPEHGFCLVTSGQAVEHAGEPAEQMPEQRVI